MFSSLKNLKKTKTCYFWFHRFKTLNYFFTYVTALKSIQINHNKKKKFILNVINFILLLKSLQFLYLAYYAVQPLDHVFHFDALWVVVARNKINLLAFRCALMTAYHNHELFYKMNVKLLDLLSRVLVLKENHFFICSKDNNLKICLVVKKTFLFIVNLFQCFDIATG